MKNSKRWIYLVSAALASAGCDSGEGGIPVSVLNDVKESAPSKKPSSAQESKLRTEAADQVVLSSALQNGWNNWSWAKYQLVNGELKVQIKKPWEGVFFEHTPQPVSNFSELRFTIKNGPQDINTLQVKARVNTRPLAGFALPALKANETRSFQVTLGELGVTDENFDGIMIQCQETGSYSVENVLFKKAPASALN